MGIHLLNWERFRGCHDLALRPQPYAVVARGEEDPERSNAFGKSSLVRAVRFVLYGDHEHRLEDGWITRGEQEGEVTVDLGELGAVTRSRKRGKATQVFFQKAKGDDAQARLEAALGFTREDFGATCYFAQGEMASHVRMKPEPRFAIVAGWVGLEKLEAAEAHNRAALNGALQACGRAAEQVRAFETALQECGDASDEKVAALEKHVEVQAARVREAEHVFRVAEEQMQRGKLEDELLDVQRQLEAVPAEDPEAESVLERAKSEESVVKLAWVRADNEERQKRLLARGKFDGSCPVAGIECPAKDAINARVEENSVLYTRAREVAGDAAKRHAMARALLQSAEERYRDEVRADARAKTLEEREAVLKAKLAHIPKIEVDFEAAAKRKVGSCDDLASARTQLELAAVALRRRADLERRLQEARQGLRAADATLGPLREASAILGRSGAQRAAAEGMLAEVEQGANSRLERCGIPFSVRVSWDREAGGLAKACGTCGEPFPKSEKVKACPRCGDARGPHVVQKLEYELSERSGAADDLVGIAIRLAASDWLRRARGAAWSVAFLDEPFGQVDASLRRFAGQQLGAMLSREFAQSFVIAHHAAALDALPGRIEVLGGAQGSSVRVVA